MPQTDLNEEQFHGRTFKGFVQFQEPGGSTWYRLKERQDMTFSMSFTRAVHYTDNGDKVVDPSGSNHTFSMTLKVTSDMFDDTFSGGSDPETLSYWIYQNTINAPIEVIFVTSMEMLSGPTGDLLDDTINIKFRLDPSTFASGLGAAGGSPVITVSGTVLEITSAIRASSADQ
jgi:hypothetical protein